MARSNITIDFDVNYEKLEMVKNEINVALNDCYENLQKVQNIVYHREYCKYCHGVTRDDDYGNCCACGAPRDYRYDSFSMYCTSA